VPRILRSPRRQTPLESSPMNERTLTLYFTDSEYADLKHIAKNIHFMAWPDFVRWAVFRGRTIPTQGREKVPDLEGRRAHVVHVPDYVHKECRMRSKARHMTMSGYANWCFRNAGWIADKSPVEEDTQVTPTPKAATSPMSRPTNLAELVEQMTIEELAQRTGTSVRQIVEWAMGTKPPKQRQVADQTDAGVLNLKAVS